MGITNQGSPHKVNSDLSKIFLFEAFNKSVSSKHQNKQGLS